MVSLLQTNNCYLCMQSQRSTHCAPPHQQGFVLVLTLWILVIITLAVSYFAQRVSRALELAQKSQINTQAMIDMESTRADILYRLTTTTLTPYGLGRPSTAIYLDNRPYEGFGQTRIQSQDTRGLISLNFVDDARLNLFLGIMGVEAQNRSQLIDTLRDYIDADDLRRLNGAEADDYRALGLPPPINRNLDTVWQAKRILGWRNTPQFWDNNRLAEVCTTSRSLGINPNTAPAEILATIPGVTQELAQVIIARRQLAPYLQESQITELTGIPLNFFGATGIVVIPSDTLRITQSGPGLSWALQYNITVTPTHPERPWRVDNYARIQLPGTLAAEEPPAPLPPHSIVPPEGPPRFLMGN